MASELHAAAAPARALVSDDEAEVEVLEYAFGDEGPPLRLVTVRQAVHARNNNSADKVVSAGDATGHRSSGGAARVLCHWLRRSGDALALRRRRVLELGCGLGLAGLYAARTAAAVTLTDGDERALALARRSHALNAPHLRAAVRTRTLPWSAQAQLAPLFEGDALLCSADAPEADAATGDQPGLLLLGADLLYYPGGVAALMEAIAALLPAGGGLVALAANPRYPGWAADVCASSRRLGLEAHCLAVEAVLPPAEQGSGWFAHTRLLLLWRAGEAAPALAPGDAAALQPLARAEGLEGGDADAAANGWLAGVSGGYCSD